MDLKHICGLLGSLNVYLEYRPLCVCARASLFCALFVWSQPKHQNTQLALSDPQEPKRLCDSLTGSHHKCKILLGSLSSLYKVTLVKKTSIQASHYGLAYLLTRLSPFHFDFASTCLFSMVKYKRLWSLACTCPFHYGFICLVFLESAGFSSLDLFLLTSFTGFMRGGEAKFWWQCAIFATLWCSWTVVLAFLRRSLWMSSFFGIWLDILALTLCKAHGLFWGVSLTDMLRDGLLWQLCFIDVFCSFYLLFL